MGIFSHFRKKNQPPSAVEEKPASQRGRAGAAATAAVPATAGDTLDSLSDASSTLQRDIARATALKIDAIESEMTLEFTSSTLAGSGAGNTVAPPAPVTTTAAANPPAPHEAQGSQAPAPAVPPASEPAAAPAPAAAAPEEWPSAPALEEAAILFASSQPALAQQILQEAIEDQTLGPAATALAWNMLFDLHQITGQREQFDALSIAYAARFETSPPAWLDAQALAAAPAEGRKPGAAPSVAFSGVLDAQSAKQLARAQKLAESHAVLRLEFSKVSAVDPVGCGLLLRVLKKLQKSGLELVLVGAPELADKIRAILAVGRRDETEAPWLLLLEILQLLNREQEFEDASIDYCVTFEVSPPAFVAPKTRVSTAPEDKPVADTGADANDALLLPQVIEGDTQPLIEAIARHIEQHQPAILDCRQLARLDFSAAGQLLGSLAVPAGKTIELHDVNHLVGTLLQTLGLQHSARIIPRKH